MNDPKVLKIEITRRCNARCVFCSHEPSDVATMPVATVAAILDAFPRAAEIQPQWFGEPMLHPEFLEVVKLCKRHGGAVRFYTNGSLVHRNMDALRLLGSGDEVIFSVEGRDAKTYESIRRGLNWDRLLDNVEMLRAGRAPGVKMTARITLCREIAGDAAAVRKFWLPRVDQVIMVPEKPLVRKISGSYRRAECRRPIDHFTVRADGKLCLCCIDYGGGIELGDVSAGPRELWESTADRRHCGHDICKKCLFKFVPDGG